MSKQQHRKQIFRGGVVMLILGTMLGITGFVSSPAGADDKVAICHRTKSVTNPYRLIMVDLSATGGPDHTTHTGSVFDPSVNTQQNKGEWGDIIPNGLNWTVAGAALHAADCQMPGEAADPEVCEFDADLDATDPDCTTPDLEPEVCAEGLVGTFPDCTTPDPEPEVCPPGQTGTPPRCEDVRSQVIPSVTPQETPEEPAPVDEPTQQPVVEPTRQPTQVEGLLLTATPTAAAPVAFAAALPRTGTTTLPLAQLGLGLLLLGAGAVIVGRDQVTTA